DLDIDTLQELESLLDGWPGTLVVISHDRYLIERVTDSTWALFGDGKLTNLPGGIEEYLARRVAMAEAEGAGVLDLGAGITAGSDAAGAADAGTGNSGAARSATPAAGSGASGSATSGLSAQEHQRITKEMNALERKMGKLDQQMDKLNQQLADAAEKMD